MLSPGLLCVSLQEPLLEDEDVDEGEGWLTNVPLCFCFFLSSLVLVTGFLSVSMFFFFFSSLFS
jgi:hypothetical protein